MTIFQAEQQLIDPFSEQDRSLKQWLMAGSIVFLVLPFVAVRQLPRPVKTGCLTIAVVCAGARASIQGSKGMKRREHLAETIQKAQVHQLQNTMKHQIVVADFQARLEAENALLEIILDLPYQQQVRWLKKYGMADLVPQPVQTIEAKAEVVREPNQLQVLGLEDWRQEKSAEMDPAALYSRCIGLSMIWAANPREGKTIAAHFALWIWAQADPNLVIFWFDPHLGMNDNPRWASNWLGIPVLTKLPKDVQTGVFKGEPRDLLKFLKVVDDLLKFRKEHNVNQPPVVVGIDEFTTQLEQIEIIPEVGEAIATQVRQIFSRIATEAPKFGIFFWLILHSLTKEEIGIPRKVLRAAHVAMGAEMTQDRIQVSNCPRTIPEKAIALVQEVFQEFGKPAGFATTLPVPEGYLPPPPIAGTEELILQWLPPGQPLEDEPPSEASESLWDDEFEAKYGADPDDLIGAEQSKAKRSRSKPKHDPEIKSRDLDQSNPMRDAFQELALWYRSLPVPPTDDVLGSKWQNLTGLRESLTADQLRYLREKLQ